MRAWLAQELADWEADDTELANALGDFATKYVREEPELTPVPDRALTTA